MYRDERGAVVALILAVDAFADAQGIGAQADAWAAVDRAARALTVYVDAAADEDARRVHGGEPSTYFLEIKGPPPSSQELAEGADPAGFASPGCGYDTQDLDDGMAMLHWAVGEGKARRIVRMDSVYTVIREVPGNFPVE